MPITFFEITTAAAFLAFAREPADFVLIEVGLGGRFDATNVIARARGDGDHAGLARSSAIPRRYVGKIAFEKAGILKAGVPAVIAPQTAAAEGGDRSTCRTRSARRFFASATNGRQPRARMAASVIAGGTATCCRGRDWWVRINMPMPAPPSRVSNASPGFSAPRELLAVGLAQVEWPARLQRLTQWHAGAVDARQVRNYGSMAATTPPAARR